MILEILLILSLLGNGLLLEDRGGLVQSNDQLQQVVEQQEILLGENYEEVGKLNEKLIEVEKSRREIFTKSEKRSIELEKLRNSDPAVDTYLDQRIPSSVVEHLQSHRED